MSIRTVRIRTVRIRNVWSGDSAHFDPVHNFINYTDDECLDRFTFGQEERMEMAGLAYRKGQ